MIFLQNLKEHLAELEKILDDVSQYYPENKIQKPMAFKHIDSMLLSKKVGGHTNIFNHCDCFIIR